MRLPFGSSSILRCARHSNLEALRRADDVGSEHELANREELLRARESLQQRCGEVDVADVCLTMLAEMTTSDFGRAEV